MRHRLVLFALLIGLGLVVGPPLSVPVAYLHASSPIGEPQHVPAALDQSIQISEIRTDQTGDDVAEYFELSGPPGVALGNLAYIVIGDGAGGSGVIETVTRLPDSQTIGSSSFFLAAKATFTLGSAGPNLTLPAAFNFENNDNVTHLLVRDFTGSNGDDLDGDDNGILDATPWSAVVDCVALLATSVGGDRTYCATAAGPVGDNAPGHILRCDGEWRVGNFTVGLDDTPGSANACSPQEPPAAGVCGETSTPIAAIQTSNRRSDAVGQRHAIEGVVVGDFRDEMGGFFVQSENPPQPGVSSGIFVRNPANSGALAEVISGRVVRVQGTVVELGASGSSLTALDNVTVIDCARTSSVTPVSLELPVVDDQSLEAVEGMLITIDQELTVTENYQLGRFGEVILSSGGRLYQPTNVVLPSEFDAYVAANRGRQIILDDGREGVYRFPVPHPAPGLSALNSLRLGDTVPAVTGVLDQRHGNYRIQPAQPLTFVRANPRPDPPAALPGTIRVASLNVLNYFLTRDALDDDTGVDDPADNVCGPDARHRHDCRGADERSVDELVRQRAKIIQALDMMDAAIVGLMELENSAGVSPLQDIVDGLNSAVGAGAYDYIETGVIGTDAIRVGLIYQPARVTPVGDFQILTSQVNSLFDDRRNRPALAQTFRNRVTRETLTVVVNHFKSKSCSSGATGPNRDRNDGQSCWNKSRVDAAAALAAWLADDPMGSRDSDILIIGDLNAYLQEDPIRKLEELGYANLLEDFVAPEEAYTKLFDGGAGALDHAFASPTLRGQVAAVAIWHINADEPEILDYNVEEKEGHLETLYSPDPYRSSDHDPVIVDLTLGSVEAGPPARPSRLQSFLRFLMWLLGL